MKYLELTEEQQMEYAGISIQLRNKIREAVGEAMAAAYSLTGCTRLAEGVAVDLAYARICSSELEELKDSIMEKEANDVAR